MLEPEHSLKCQPGPKGLGVAFSSLDKADSGRFPACSSLFRQKRMGYACKDANRLIEPGSPSTGSKDYDVVCAFTRKDCGLASIPMVVNGAVCPGTPFRAASVGELE